MARLYASPAYPGAFHVPRRESFAHIAPTDSGGPLGDEPQGRRLRPRRPKPRVRRTSWREEGWEDERPPTPIPTGRMSASTLQRTPRRRPRRQSPHGRWSQSNGAHGVAWRLGLVDLGPEDHENQRAGPRSSGALGVKLRVRNGIATRTKQPLSPPISLPASRSEPGLCAWSHPPQMRAGETKREAPPKQKAPRPSSMRMFTSHALVPPRPAHRLPRPSTFSSRLARGAMTIS